ncbi:L-serine ammonia-lyase [Flavobacteriaceae bacterium UJ101]|nr:L-serine ammonia-lyase [Flavobacteriaceae bacterium UJ101]
MSGISVFEILKIGVGPSSSHTLGPWRAAERWIQELKKKDVFEEIQEIKVHLYGSLSLTGKGHATDLASILGLNGEDPEYIDVYQIETILQEIKDTKIIRLGGKQDVHFDFDKNVVFHKEFLPFHPNGITFEAILNDGMISSETYYSIGGGFVVKEDDDSGKSTSKKPFDFPIETASQLLHYCKEFKLPISDVVLRNEKSLRSVDDIKSELNRIWNVMLESMYIGCHTEGILPGGLNVRRRAYDIHKKHKSVRNYNSHENWIDSFRSLKITRFQQILKWIGCFALSVNEVNASLGRVVTAPTNGSSGVIPAVMMYYLCFINHEAGEEEIQKFLLVAGEIGSIYKKGATISAAMGGCQAEIGVSSSMAAAALCELMGGSPEQALAAAEIAMEHHLGLTCDPIGGLVQIPCIERNYMGAVKAISAAELALETDTDHSKVSLDEVVRTMMETAKDMNRKYKETSEGGLAIQTFLVDC